MELEYVARDLGKRGLVRGWGTCLGCHGSPGHDKVHLRLLFQGKMGPAIASYSEALSHSGKEGYTESRKVTHKGKKRLACVSLGMGIGMIIDSHVHLIGEGWMNRSLAIGIGRLAAAAMGKTTGNYPDPEGLVASMTPTMTDTTGEKLIVLMDRAGVDKSVIFAADLGLCTGEPEVRIQEQNRIIAEASRRFPDRLVPFFAIDPRRTKAMNMFRLAVEDWGMRGLKLHTVTGYYPHDRVAYPFYEKCMEYGMPVFFDTGSTCAPMKSRFAQPIHLDDVAADFPDLPIVMAHVAQEMWEEALTVARMKTNVYFDISGWQGAAANQPRVFYRMLRQLLDEVGPWRVFFASDGPFSELACPLDRWVKALTKPDLSSCQEVMFAPDEIEIVMGKAFARLLKL